MKQESKLKKHSLILVGHTFLGLGILGIFLPLMPTTIFLILSGACYAKSSPRMHDWLLTNKYFGKYLKNYREEKGTPLKLKIFSITILWVTIGYSILFNSIPLWVTIVLLLIAISVTIHLITIKTFKES